MGLAKKLFSDWRALADIQYYQGGGMVSVPGGDGFCVSINNTIVRVLSGGG